MRCLYFLPVLCLTVCLAGCFPVKIHADDPFFTVGHTYRTAEECFLIFWPRQQEPDGYTPEGTLYPVSLTHHVQDRIAELREKKTIVLKNCHVYSGRIVYVPAGTEFRVDRAYRLFPNCLENNLLRRDITMFGEFGKYKPASLVTRIQAIDVTRKKTASSP